MHRSKHKPSILDPPQDVLWSIIPVDPNGVDRRLRIVICMQEFHDAREVIGFAWRLADQVDVV